MEFRNTYSGLSNHKRLYRKFYCKERIEKHGMNLDHSFNRNICLSFLHVSGIQYLANFLDDESSSLVPVFFLLLLLSSFAKFS